MPETSRTDCFWIYILECDDGSYYTGYTADLARRYRLHVEGKAGARYTRSHPPVRIAQCWRLFENVGTALKVEKLVKRRSRTAKARLVARPGELRALASNKLDRSVRIYAADPAAVQSESMGEMSERVRAAHRSPSGDASRARRAPAGADSVDE
jgi:putative endonuclease